MAFLLTGLLALGMGLLALREYGRRRLIESEIRRLQKDWNEVLLRSENEERERLTLEKKARLRHVVDLYVELIGRGSEQGPASLLRAGAALLESSAEIREVGHLVLRRGLQNPLRVLDDYRSIDLKTFFDTAAEGGADLEGAGVVDLANRLSSGALRAAVEDAAVREEISVSAILGDADRRLQSEVSHMKPLIQQLQLLREELGEIPGLRIEPAPRGHMATVESASSVHRARLRIGFDERDQQFHVERRDDYFFADGGSHKKHERFGTPHEVMERVTDLVGTYLGARRAHDARRPPG